jgi:hypothetical protein
MIDMIRPDIDQLNAKEREERIAIKSNITTTSRTEGEGKDWAQTPHLPTIPISGVLTILK